MAKGDIVLIAFPFTDLSGNKLRPAIVLFEGTRDKTVCFITSQTNAQDPTDQLISPSPENGLKKRSLIRTSKIATLDTALAKGLLGKMTSVELAKLDANLKILLQL